MSDRYCIVAYLLYVDFNICEEGTGAGVYSGLRFRNQDSGNEYPSDFGGSARENIYEPRQTARYEGCIGEDG